MNFLWTKDGLDAIIALGWSATIGTAVLRLYSNNIGWDWLRAIGDLTEATYTGYTHITALGGATKGPYQDPILNEIYYKLPMDTFGLCTAVPQTLYGAYVTDSAGSDVYGMLVFDAPMGVTVGATPRLNVLFPFGEGTELSGSELDLS